MRNRLADTIVGLAATLALSAFSSVAMAQAPQPQQGTKVRPVWKYDPADRAIGPGGPAPKRDLSGTWAGPRSGAGVADGERGDTPSLTPLAQELKNQNKPLGKYSPAGTNDPNVRTCDPLGFPRNATTQIRHIAFGTMPNRIILLTQFMDVWREIWMDGRALPTNVGSDQPGSPDPRYNGYSVGHWEDDYTLVVDTTGLDESTWLTGEGLPHSMNARIQERYKRTSQNDLQVTITVDDPTMYTKPFSLGTNHYRWIPNQMMDEKLCVPSNVIEYLRTIGDPAGSDPNANTGRY